jgi:predicted neutral ceramidase superfamily lipid hydrolase
MLDFSTIAEFSRNHCIGICAFLVPANLLATVLTIILTVLGRPIYQIWQSLSLASIFATAMIYHVYTWFMVGVVMLPTYILLALAITCLLSNFIAVILHKRYFRYHNISQNA